MNRSAFLLCGLLLALQPLSTFAQARDGGRAVTERDGQRDFDFEVGTSKTHLKRLQRPLTGSKTWVEYDGTTIRFVISDITPKSCRFEQAFSDDGGETWEVNWIATDTCT